MVTRMDYDKQQNNYTVNNKRSFGSGKIINISQNQLFQAIKFGWHMTFGKTGEHRSSRSGGSLKRDDRQKFIDTLLGKLGEFGVYNNYHGKSTVFSISSVDLDCYQLGQWDEMDFEITNQQMETYKLAIKTTKHFGSLLLLECKDWQIIEGNAIYLPNKEKPSNGYYDYFIFCRVETNIDNLLKNHSNFLESEDNLIELAQEIEVKCELTGIVPNSTIAYCIANQFKINRGAFLNFKTKIDADNYYLQSGDFINIGNS